MESQPLPTCLFLSPLPHMVTQVQMLRGAAMEAYFEAHFSPEQSAFMKEVLALPALPGSFPPAVRTLMRPMDDTTTRA